MNEGATAPGAAGAAGVTSVAPAAGAGAPPIAGAAVGVPVAGVSATAAAGSAAPSGGNMLAGTGAAAAAGHAGHMDTAGSGAPMTPMMEAAMHACKLHTTADPRDAMLTNEPLIMNIGASKDTLMPQIVLDWMNEYQFAESHDGWHLVRKWDQTCRKSNATTCAAAMRLVNQGLSRAPIQQGAPGDGVAFMMMHRHMIMMLKTAFPNHTALFEGFTKVPRTQSDPANPQPWRAVNWTSNNIKGFDILENIEKNLSQFPTEDDLGAYIENTYKWTEQSPTTPVNAPGSGLHGALHSQWSVNGSPANLIQQAVDVRNYAFWKLHGWIDNIWERYRKAKGMKDDDPAYQKLMLEQCMEMFMLQPRNRGMKPGDPTTGTAGTGSTAPETGMFATQVRPFLDSTCGGCHSAIAPSAGMTLGGAGISSKEIIEGLVSQKATNGEYNLIEPGQPDKSWVYLKASGGSATATCTKMCDRESMPPSGMGLNATQLGTLRQWIMNGATSM
ncbi:MAG TPA: hypothetical protein VJR89_14530 [Polyangiales bacterium]|nr:hypothetical protein [Polyangiales bacterium]